MNSSSQKTLKAEIGKAEIGGAGGTPEWWERAPVGERMLLLLDYAVRAQSSD